MDLAAALEDAVNQYERLTAEEARIADRKRNIRLEIEGLQLALARHERDADAPDERQPVTVTEHPISTMARTDAIEWVLKEYGPDTPVSPAQITETLEVFGRIDEYNAVSAALAHLQRSGRAHALARGKWVYGPKPPAVAPWAYDPNEEPF